MDFARSAFGVRCVLASLSLSQCRCDFAHFRGLASSFIFGTWGLTLTWDLALGIWDFLASAASMAENNPSGSSDRDSLERSRVAPGGNL